MPDAIARRLRVHGRVQGVGFRDATAGEARRHGVSGWVRNCPDGTVEAHVEGPDDGVRAIVAFLHEGPRGARVDRVDEEDAAAEGGSGFEVR